MFTFIHVASFRFSILCIVKGFQKERGFKYPTKHKFLQSYDASNSFMASAINISFYGVKCEYSRVPTLIKIGRSAEPSPQLAVAPDRRLRAGCRAPSSPHLQYALD